MEFWDVYTSDRKLTGQTVEKDYRDFQPGEFHISVLGALKRPDGRYLITQRKRNKKWGAGWWELPGGGVCAGETSFAAAVREVFEETGIDVSGLPQRIALSYSRENPLERNNYFLDVYLFELDFSASDVSAQAEEVEDFRLATPQEISELGMSGIFLHYDSIKEIFT